MKKRSYSRMILRYGLEALCWPLACVACMQGFVSLGMLDGQGWKETVALWNISARHLEAQAASRLDQVLRDKVDPVLMAAAQQAEARLNTSLAGPEASAPGITQARPTPTPALPRREEAAPPLLSPVMTGSPGMPVAQQRHRASPVGWELRAF